ncbi:MAG: glycolate oxidase subunit GlcE [Pseudomonadota bacterium]
MNVVDNNIEDTLRASVSAHAESKSAVHIVGGNSKAFYGNAVTGDELSVRDHTGIIDYDPAEMVITVRAGTRLSDVSALLAENRQMLGFEPPDYSGTTTIGGALATGLCGPRRASAGSARDFLLGARIIDGRAQTLNFGGRVIKNVAGFDLARVMVGAQGTLGVLLEVSIKVVPIPHAEVSLAFEHTSADEHIQWINELGSAPHPISASLWRDQKSTLRLSGSESGVESAVRKLGGDRIEHNWNGHDWQDDSMRAVTRVSLPPATTDILKQSDQIIEWGGAQRWLIGDTHIARLRDQVSASGGAVCAYRNHARDVSIFQPLTPAILSLQNQLKTSFDPHGILNPGRVYATL